MHAMLGQKKVYLGLLVVLVVFLIISTAYLNRKLFPVHIGWSAKSSTRWPVPASRVIDSETLRTATLRYYQKLSENAVRKSRLPDVIGIGVEKCGSGALINFLRQHPLIKVKKLEVHFFDGHYSKGLDYYRSQLPLAADFELVMEKTPGYFNKPEVDVPFLVKKNVPDVKVIAILCDPVNRTFSDFIHEQIAGTIPKSMIFEVFIDQYLMQFKGPPFQGMNDFSASSYIRAKDQNFHLSHVISAGLYYYHVKHWRRYFGEDRFMIVDGEGFLRDPGKVVDEVQDFLGLDKLLLPSDFQKGRDNEFYCVRKSSLASENRTLECLESYRKGRTRLGTLHPAESAMRKLREFYKPYNEKLFAYLNRRFQWQ